MKVIGKRVQVFIGGSISLEDRDTIVLGSDTRLHITDEEFQKSHHIVGEEILLFIGGEFDQKVEAIKNAIAEDSDTRREEITKICEQILASKEQHSKRALVARLISTGADISSIASMILQLKGMLS